MQPQWIWTKVHCFIVSIVVFAIIPIETYTPSLINSATEACVNIFVALLKLVAYSIRGTKSDRGTRTHSGNLILTDGTLYITSKVFLLICRDEFGSSQRLCETVIFFAIYIGISILSIEYALWDIDSYISFSQEKMIRNSLESNSIFNGNFRISPAFFQRVTHGTGSSNSWNTLKGLK